MSNYKYLFGPVNSRRLGVSLGVDLAPRKVCTLDCVYCEVGATTILTTARKEYVKYDKIIAEIQDYLSRFPMPDYVTLTGSGEPTLNIRFGDVLSFIKTNYPKIKVAVLTNGTLMNDPLVRQEMLLADLVMPSLDAVSLEAFNNIDKPAPEIKMEDYINGIASFKKEFKGEMNLEILLLHGYNFNKPELDLLREAIIKINPDKVQLNTLDRPGVLDNLIPLSQDELEWVINYLNLPNIEIIARNPSKNTQVIDFSDSKSGVLELLKRRPCTIDDILSVLNMDSVVLNQILENLIIEGRVEKVNEKAGTFYRFLIKKKID
jgi:wyosine [tRNA(Phe)-imidazoG37] synthetase (radical SAM superfamily)